MLSNIIIVVLAIIGISDGASIFKQSKNPKPSVEIPNPSSYGEQGEEKRGGWDHN